MGSAWNQPVWGQVRMSSNQAGEGPPELFQFYGSFIIKRLFKVEPVLPHRFSYSTNNSISFHLPLKGVERGLQVLLWKKRN